MFIYQVRVFKHNEWYEIRSYSDEATALGFADCLDGVWDIKKITLEEANAQIV